MWLLADWLTRQCGTRSVPGRVCHRFGRRARVPPAEPGRQSACERRRGRSNRTSYRLHRSKRLAVIYVEAHGTDLHSTSRTKGPPRSSPAARFGGRWRGRAAGTAVSSPGSPQTSPEPAVFGTRDTAESAADGRTTRCPSRRIAIRQACQAVTSVHLETACSWSVWHTVGSRTDRPIGKCATALGSHPATTCKHPFDSRRHSLVIFAQLSGLSKRFKLDRPLHLLVPAILGEHSQHRGKRKRECSSVWRSSRRRHAVTAHKAAGPPRAGKASSRPQARPASSAFWAEWNRHEAPLDSQPAARVQCGHRAQCRNRQRT